MDAVSIGGQRGHHKADGQPRQHPLHRPAPAVVQGDVADNGGQRGGHQSNADVARQRLLAQLGIQPGSGQNGPDIDKILAEEGKAGHQPHLHQGHAVQGVPRQVEHADGNGGDDGGVHQRRPRTGHQHIIGDKGVLGGHDFIQPPQDVLPAVYGEENAGQGQQARVYPQIGKHFVISGLVLVVQLVEKSHGRYPPKYSRVSSAFF